MSHARNELFRRLPQIGEFLETGAGRELLRLHPRPLVVQAVRAAIEALRADIDERGLAERDIEARIAELPARIAGLVTEAGDGALRPIINATGVILQTNLGRAPLSARAVEAIAQVSGGYCNLEFDLASGTRGKRGAHVERLLLQVLALQASSNASLVVNNCAAATLLALNTLADGGEVIVSRGELVEIGGGFRVPDILRKSGARLVEVGTTNRTRVEDYAAAISADTRLLLRVHRSNFEIVGFTEEPRLEELVELGRKAGVPLFVDQGTGCVISPSNYGLGRQSTFVDAIASGAELVSASGDKLLGGPQCGLLVGQRKLIERLRGNPLCRALRVDKMTIVALEETLMAYLSDEVETIPAIGMLGLSAESIRARCETVAEKLTGGPIVAKVTPAESVVGGGTTPGTTVASFALAIEIDQMSAEELAMRLRRVNPPVIGRIQRDRVLLDLRTVPEHLDELLISGLRKCAASARGDR